MYQYFLFLESKLSNVVNKNKIDTEIKKFNDGLRELSKRNDNAKLSRYNVRRNKALNFTLTFRNWLATQYVNIPNVERIIASFKGSKNNKKQRINKVMGVGNKYDKINL